MNPTENMNTVERKYRYIGSALFVEAGMLIAVAVGFTLLEFAAFATDGLEGIIALVLALAPVPLLWSLGLWLDRFEPEPPWLLARTFLWGAAVATLVAGIINTTVGMVAGEFVAAVICAPLIEEAMKGTGVLYVFRKRREHFNGRMDAVVYALFVGLGFAVVENVQYYAMGYHEGTDVFTATVIMRGLLTPFLHPLFTVFTALAVARAAEKGKSVINLRTLGGYWCAVFAHGLWNSGIGIFIYPFVLVPLFIWFVRRILRLRTDQHGEVGAYLKPEIDAGLIPLPVVQRLVLGDFRPRETFRALGKSDHPLHQWRAFHHAAYQLASYRRMGGTDAAIEAQLREQMTTELALLTM